MELLKKIVLTAALIVGIGSLFGCDAKSMGSLDTLTKPHVGFYECTEATLGGEDLLEKFEYLRLELKKDGTYDVRYRLKGKSERIASGEYEFDRENSKFIAKHRYGELNGDVAFSAARGIVTVFHNVGGRALSVKFKITA